MTNAHNPRVLTDADSAADLAGLPRPGDLPQLPEAELYLTANGNDGRWCETRTGGEPAFSATQMRAYAAQCCATLVSERDALAVRVSELTDDRDCWRDQCSQRVADWAAEHERVRELEQENSKLVSTLAECRDIFLAPPPGGAAEHEWMQAMGCPESVPNFIRAALTPQEKTNG